MFITSQDEIGEPAQVFFRDYEISLMTAEEIDWFEGILLSREKDKKDSTVGVYEYTEANFQKLRALEHNLIKREKDRKKAAFRRYRHMGVAGVHTKSDLKEIFDIQEGLCYFSREPLTEAPSNYSLDHLIPIAKDGTDWPGNLAFVKTYYNSLKRNLSFASFMRQFNKQISKEEVVELNNWRKSVNKERLKLHRRRVEIVKEVFKDVEHALQLRFDDEIEYSLDLNNGLSLYDYSSQSEIDFAPGFMRRKKSKDPEFLAHFINLMRSV